MNRQQIVASIHQEIKRLREATLLLEGTGRTPIHGKYKKPGGYILSAAARKRISDAQKARWAKKKDDALAKERKQKKRPAAV